MKESIKERWLDFAADTKVSELLKEIRSAAGKNGIKHVSIQILDGEIYAYTNDGAEVYNLQIGQPGLKVEMGNTTFLRPK